MADFRASSLCTLVEVVASGVGATLAPAMASASVKRALRGLALLPFTHPAPGRTIRLAFRPTTLWREAFDELGDLMASRALPAPAPRR